VGHPIVTNVDFVGVFFVVQGGDAALPKLLLDFLFLSRIERMFHCTAIMEMLPLSYAFPMSSASCFILINDILKLTNKKTLWSKVIRPAHRKFKPSQLGLETGTNCSVNLSLARSVL